MVVPIKNITHRNKELESVDTDYKNGYRVMQCVGV